MRLKNDFVTNSSTCSIIIWGMAFEKDDLKSEINGNRSILRKLHEEYKGSKEDIKDDDLLTWFHDLPTYEVSELIESMTEGISVNTGPDYDYYIYIGKGVEKQKEDQTLGDFKEEIANGINAGLGTSYTKADIGFIELAWRDG